VSKFYLIVGSVIVGMLAYGTGVFGNSRFIVMLAAVGIIFLVVRSWAMTSTPLGGRMVKGHIHAGDLNMVRRHEGGHASVAEGLGGRVVKIETYENGGGWTYVRIPYNTSIKGDWQRKSTAFLLGGQMAVNSQKGCSYDNEQIRKNLNTVPSSMRGQVKADARRLAAKNLGRVNHWANKAVHK
jgi:hypothetical protein